MKTKDERTAALQKRLEKANKVPKAPSFADVYNNRGHAYYDQRNLDMAISDFNEAIRLNPGFADAYNNHGYAQHLTGNSAEANADFTTARRLKAAQ